QLRFDFNPLNLRSAKVESVSTLLDLMQDPAATPYTANLLAPSLDEAQKLAQRLDQLPEVAMTLTLASFIPKDQDAKLALIGDAAQLLDLTLNPLDVKASPTDGESVAAMRAAADKLRLAALTAKGAEGDTARGLADVLSVLAEADPARRQIAEDGLLPGLRKLREQLRTALQAEPVTLASLPPQIKHDWLTADGRARIEVNPT